MNISSGYFSPSNRNKDFRNRPDMKCVDTVIYILKFVGFFFFIFWFQSCSLHAMHTAVPESIHVDLNTHGKLVCKTGTLICM